MTEVNLILGTVSTEEVKVIPGVRLGLTSVNSFVVLGVKLILPVDVRMRSVVWPPARVDSIFFDVEREWLIPMPSVGFSVEPVKSVIFPTGSENSIELVAVPTVRSPAHVGVTCTYAE